MKPIINKKAARKNKAVKKIIRQGKKIYQKGDRRVLKSYIGKVTQIYSMELLGTENRIDRPVHKEQVTREYFLQKLEASGLTGMGGGGFPVIKKINAFLSSDEGNRRVIINAVECEPGLKHDEWLLFNRKDEIAAGIGYIKDVFASRISFAAISPELNIGNENRCKGCGRCTVKCPSGVQIHKIVKTLEKDENADISMYYPEKCIQCGCCAYFCMAGKIPYRYIIKVECERTS